MGEPFIGSEVLGSGALNRYQLRTQYRAILPGIYLDKRLTPSLSNRTKAAWLWSGREAVVSGLAAAALHGSKWIDGASDIELGYANTRPPGGVVTRNDTLLDDEVQIIDGMKVTTPERTAFDIARRGRLGHAVARLDSLAAPTGFKVPHVQELAARHRHVRGLRQLEAALALVDAGAQSPKETWLRLVLIRAGFPRPQTQIPIYDDDGYPIAFLDMGWEGPKVAAEYDGDQHRTDRRQYVKDIRRLDLLRRLGWNIIRVVAEDHADDVVYRVSRALTSRSG